MGPLKSDYNKGLIALALVICITPNSGTTICLGQTKFVGHKRVDLCESFKCFSQFSFSKCEMGVNMFVLAKLDSTRNICRAPYISSKSKHIR